MQDVLTLLTVSAAVLYLLKVFALPSLGRGRAPDVPLKNLLRKARPQSAKRYSGSPAVNRS